MLDQLAQMNMSIYFQTLIFIVFLVLLFRLHWKMGSVMHIVVNVIKYFVFILIFIYLFLNWASDVNPTLRNSSILVMALKSSPKSASSYFCSPSAWSCLSPIYRDCAARSSLAAHPKWS